MKKKGISLIVLIITIIVIVILAVAVILTISRNNPVEVAKEAKFKNNLKNYQHELQLFIANQNLEDHGYNLETLSASESKSSHYKKGEPISIEGNIKGVITSIKDEDMKIVEVYEGKLVLNYSATNLQLEWAKELDIGTKGMVIPKDWPDIRKTAKENSISLLAKQGEIGLTTTLNNTSATYTVEWGDESVETFASGTPATHTYTEDNYYDIKVYSEGNDITQLKVTSGASLLMCYLNCNTLTSMEGMFNNTGIQVFDVYDKSATSKVTTMNTMFSVCKSLTSISQLDTSQLENMSYMFYGCKELTSIPEFDTSQVKDMSLMFSGCTSLISIPELDVSQVTDMSYMFQNCSSLTSISNMDASQVTNMNSMFMGCSSLTSIQWLNTSQVTSVMNTFRGCSSLISISTLDASKIEGFSATFQDCSSLEKIKIKNTGTNGKVITNLIGALPSRSGKSVGSLDLTESVITGVNENSATIKNWAIIK